jgi:hypothetical protein
MSKKIVITNDGDVERLVVDQEQYTVNVVEVTPAANVITVNTPGPTGPRGLRGEQGDSIFALTGSYYSGILNLQVTGSVFASLFGGDGSELYNISTSSIVNFDGEVTRLTFPYQGTAEITGSISLQKDENSNLDFFIIKSGSFNSISINSEGVLKLGEFQYKPEPVEGGIMYYNSEFWLGFQD